ncbi:MAG: circularly permuted type 2 ATP-grasp protein, partial [Mycobacterium sp.]|nr:circularly permuted type 2 ATP-grasp protein [Mycobacterium sp.]
MVLRTHSSQELASPESAEARPPIAGDPLAGYRAARAQEPLFDVRDVAGAGYDELVDETGAIRPAWHELTDCVRERGRPGLDQLRGVVQELVDIDGITYVQVDRAGETVTDRDGAPVVDTWRLDALPLLLSAEDWHTQESGLVQRSRLLDAVLTDLYGARRSITSG